MGGRRASISVSRRSSVDVDLSVEPNASMPSAGSSAAALLMSPGKSIAAIRSQLAEARARTETLQRMRGAAR